MMDGTNFNPKIFTDITIPDTKFYIPHTGKVSALRMMEEAKAIL